MTNIGQNETDSTQGRQYSSIQWLLIVIAILSILSAREYDIAIAVIGNTVCVGSLRKLSRSELVDPGSRSITALVTSSNAKLQITSDLERSRHVTEHEVQSNSRQNQPFGRLTR
jgi:hypothetical protein